MKKRCAIYSRVSTSMQNEAEYSSCDAQRDRIMSFIKSQEDLEFTKEYSDPAFSGKDLERPSLQQLFKDITQKKIDVVLTYKIDRFTRSLKDFYSVIEFFEKYNVSYISVTERFDTSSPSGRLLRNIMLTFAQFEREMGSERIKHKIEQMAIKGIWYGGRAPFGYKNEDKKLLIDKKTAPFVRLMFEEFIATGSIVAVMKRIKEENIMKVYNDTPYPLNSVFRILRNPVYIGKIKWNEKVFDGLHEPIISKEIFNEAQSLTTKKVRKKRLYKEFLLSGLVKCGSCESSMTNVFTNKIKRRYYYYKCNKVAKEGKNAVCSVREVNAEKIELFIIENLSRISQDRQYIDNLVFRLVHKIPHGSGIEPTEVSSEKLANRVQQVLMEFKNKMENSTQIEKCLAVKRVIRKIVFSKDTLEVFISIEDTTNDEILNLSGLGSGEGVARMRGVLPNSCAPVNDIEFAKQKREPTGDRTQDTCLKRAVLYRLSYRLSTFLILDEFFFFGGLGLIDQLDILIGQLLDFRLGLETLVLSDRLFFLDLLDAFVRLATNRP